MTIRWSGHFFEEFPAEGLPLDFKTSSLVVRQRSSSPMELTLEDAVLLDQVIDDSLLVAVDPAATATIRSSHWCTALLIREDFSLS